MLVGQSKIGESLKANEEDCMRVLIRLLVIVFMLILTSGCTQQKQTIKENPLLIPVIENPWWKIAGNPDLGPLNMEGQFPTAFAVWQAADGTWQLLSCVRGTGIGGKTRLFHRWQGGALTDTDWDPKGVALTADSAFGETPGGLQAPYVMQQGETHFLFYGDWENICLARSQDGKTFARSLNPEKTSALFSHGKGINTKDPMMLQIDGRFHLYYAAVPNDRAAIYCTTSDDLVTWGPPQKVSSGGSAGYGPEAAESPNVIYIPEADRYYLFRSHKSTETGTFVTTVYASHNPLDFGIDNDEYRVCRLPVEGIRVIHHDNTYYIASLMPGLKGTRMARLRWEVH